MTRGITPAGSPATAAVDEVFAEVRASFDRFCLAAGLEVLGEMLEADVAALCGPRHGRGGGRQAQRWGELSLVDSGAERLRRLKAIYEELLVPKRLGQIHTNEFLNSSDKKT